MAGSLNGLTVGEPRGILSNSSATTPSTPAAMSTDSSGIVLVVAAGGVPDRTVTGASVTVVVSTIETSVAVVGSALTVVEVSTESVVVGVVVDVRPSVLDDAPVGPLDTDTADEENIEELLADCSPDGLDVADGSATCAAAVAPAPSQTMPATANSARQTWVARDELVTRSLSGVPGIRIHTCG